MEKAKCLNFLLELLIFKFFVVILYAVSLQAPEMKFGLFVVSVSPYEATSRVHTVENNFKVLAA
jgi:hypothetical protein